MKTRVDPLGAEVRSIEEGLRVRMLDDGTFHVRCVSGDHEGHTLAVSGFVVHDEGWLIKVRCDCPSGLSRPSEAVPCLHAAAVARRLERMGWARWDGGKWYATDKAKRAVREASQ